MSGALHYPFPPARAYALNRCLYAIKSDPGFCARFLSDSSEAIRDMTLTPIERSALAVFDEEEIVSLGGHPYLVFMAGLRLKMTREPTTLEYF